jgi:acetolactate synthase small subunit
MLNGAEFQKLIPRYSLGLINTNDDYSTFELSSDNETINEFLKGMAPNTIAQITRTGVSGINITIE